MYDQKLLCAYRFKTNIANEIVTPGITALEYHLRRARLIEKLPVGSAAILVGNEIKYRSGAVFYEFHQNPDFFYLTGFNEPLAVTVIEKPVEDDYVFHMFVQPKDEKKELWEGPRTGVQGAIDVFNADEVIFSSVDTISKVLTSYRPVILRTFATFSAKLSNAQILFTSIFHLRHPMYQAFSLPPLSEQQQNRVF